MSKKTIIWILCLLIILQVCWLNFKISELQKRSTRNLMMEEIGRLEEEARENLGEVKEINLPN